MNTSSFHLNPSIGQSIGLSIGQSTGPSIGQVTGPTLGNQSSGVCGNLSSRTGTPNASRSLGSRLPRLLLGLVVGLGLSLGGCNNSGGSLLEEPGAALLPGVKINLPPPPSFAEPNIPRDYPEGSVSIYGLRKEFHRYSEKPNKYLGQKVKVKAYLLDIYKCPECPKKQTCKPCDAPHMFVVDEASAPKEKALLVAEYRGYKGKEPKLTIGKQYTYEGTFQTTSPAGFSASDGLLVFNKMLDDTNKEFTGPAEEAEKQAAIAQAAYEKAMKAKGAQK